MLPADTPETPAGLQAAAASAASARTSTTPDEDLRREVISSVGGFRALRSDWTDLLAAGGAASPFLTWEWLFAWWLHYGERRPGRELAIVTLRDRQRLAGVLPAYVKTSARIVRTLRLLGSPHESSDDMDVPQRDPASDEVLPLLVAHARESLSFDRICIGDVAADAAVVDRMRALARRQGWSLAVQCTHVCPYLPVAGSWDDYLASRSRGFRQALRRRTRRFMERSGARFDWVELASELPSALDDVFALHARRFAGRRARTRFVATRRGAFHREVSRIMFDAGALRLFRLRVDGRTVATLYCFEHGSRLHYYQGGIDPDWDRESVGTVLMGQVVKYAFDRKLSTFEFLRGVERYKFKWTDRARQLVRVDLGLSRRGRLLVGLAGAYGSIQKVAPKPRWAGLNNPP
ncbi:MAG: GNAT family N-acetyltransferase [Vicinamibacterales bacterium]